MTVTLPCGLTVEVATTQAAWAKGLSGRTELNGLDGMLFVFQKDAPWPVWMEGMHFPLYVYWITAAGELIGESWMPESCSVLHCPVVPCRYVLETRFPMPWRIGDLVSLAGVHESLRSPNADS